MIQKYGEAHWEGGLRGGQGRLSTETGVLKDQGYSFAKRFGDEAGTNPEELIGAAHAGCYSMFLAALLSKAGYTPTSVETTAKVRIEATDGGPAITRITLSTRADVPGVEDAEFQEKAVEAKANCPVSKALAGVGEVILEATLA